MITLAVPAFAADSTEFTDVAAGAWYADAVSFVQSRGLMSGTGSWQEGQWFSSGAGESTVAAWVASMGYNK